MCHGFEEARRPGVHSSRRDVCIPPPSPFDFVDSLRHQGPRQNSSGPFVFVLCLCGSILMSLSVDNQSRLDSAQSVARRFVMKNDSFTFQNKILTLAEDL
jgi:hypothetical protein